MHATGAVTRAPHVLRSEEDSRRRGVLVMARIRQDGESSLTHSVIGVAGGGGGLQGGGPGREAATLPCFFFFTLVTGPRRQLSLKLSDARVYEPQERALRPQLAGRGAERKMEGSTRVATFLIWMDIAPP